MQDIFPRKAMSHFKTFKKIALTHQSVFHETADYTILATKEVKK
jgi:hypothetical protein